MANRFKGITKDVLLDLFETGKLAVTGKSSYYAIENWRFQAPKDKVVEEKRKMRKRFSDALWRLKKSRLVIVQEKEDGKFLVQLTERGKRKIREIQFMDLQITKPKKWDGVWRIVIFDIPNTKHKGRNALRDKLKELGFYQLQKSIWVLPYPCEPEIEFIVELFELYPYVNLVEARRIKDDTKLRKYFHLF